MTIDADSIQKTRLDTAVNEPLTALASAGAAAFGYTSTLKLDHELAQLLRLRVAQINDCTYCLGVHYPAARAAGISQTRIDTVSAWWETRLFTSAERAALAYAEALTRLADPAVSRGFQQVHEELAAHFEADVLVEIVGVIVNMNIWTRLKRAEGAMPTTDMPTADLPTAGVPGTDRRPGA
ncbi:carboxymuconolactone decarboxylase family protein [uncultured Arthrobacter sp.]|uniref:carboxymuconolactone decarboxylase family protein n=1 Tax=uncultured Arthrobacter sp. TaxID=114050 RepID=UPI0025F243E4|nr:carboxymuconolactone decarboxylase family protein [uncultured Arthrobacter sp.]